MSFWDRLRAAEEPIFNAHAFMFEMREWERGADGFNNAAVIARLDISGGEITEAAEFKVIFQTAIANGHRDMFLQVLHELLCWTQENNTPESPQPPYMTAEDFKTRLQLAADSGL